MQATDLNMFPCLGSNKLCAQYVHEFLSEFGHPKILCAKTIDFESSHCDSMSTKGVKNVGGSSEVENHLGWP